MNQILTAVRDEFADEDSAPQELCGIKSRTDEFEKLKFGEVKNFPGCLNPGNSEER